MNRCPYCKEGWMLCVVGGVWKHRTHGDYGLGESLWEDHWRYCAFWNAA